MSGLPRPQPEGASNHILEDAGQPSKHVGGPNTRVESYL